MSALVDDGDVGDANMLQFGSVAEGGESGAIEFLMNHEVVALLETVVAAREQKGDDPMRMRQALDFCKKRTDCTDLGPAKLQAFCRSTRGKLQGMVDGAALDSGGGLGDEDGGERLDPFEVAQLANLIDADQAEVRAGRDCRHMRSTGGST
jgi:hypothetical protein